MTQVETELVEEVKHTHSGGEEGGVEQAIECDTTLEGGQLRKL